MSVLQCLACDLREEPSCAAAEFSLAWKVERKNVLPVAGGKKVKSRGRSRGEHGAGLMGREVGRACGPNGNGDGHI